MVDPTILESQPEMKKQGVKAGTEIQLQLPEDVAMQLMARKIVRLEKIVEMLYHTRPATITTPESLSVKEDLDKLIRYKTA